MLAGTDRHAPGRGRCTNFTPPTSDRFRSPLKRRRDANSKKMNRWFPPRAERSWAKDYDL
jgi:hypothetical protein